MLKRTPLKKKTPLKAKTRLHQKTPLKSKSALKAKKGLNSYSTLKTYKPLKAKTQLKAKKGLKTNSVLEAKTPLKAKDSTLKRTPLKKVYKPTPERTSIVFPNLHKCCLCGLVEDEKKGIRISKHEIFFGTANRKKSIEDKMIAPLCDKCHLNSSNAVHKNKEIDDKLKQQAQTVWEKEYGSREAFMERYGKSWL